MKTATEYLHECVRQYWHEINRWDLPLYLDHTAIHMVTLSYDLIQRGVLLMMNTDDVLKSTVTICHKCFYHFLGACKPERDGEICIGRWCELLAIYMIKGGEY